jgi:hypothetical protein
MAENPNDSERYVITKSDYGSVIPFMPSGIGPQFHEVEVQTTRQTDQGTEVRIARGVGYDPDQAFQAARDKLKG